MDSYHIATTKNSNHIPIMPLLLLETITSLIFRLKAFDFIVKKLDLHKNPIHCYKIEEKQKQLLFDTPARSLFQQIEFYKMHSVRNFHFLSKNSNMLKEMTFFHFYLNAALLLLQSS